MKTDKSDILFLGEAKAKLQTFCIAIEIFLYFLSFLPCVFVVFYTASSQSILIITATIFIGYFLAKLLFVLFSGLIVGLAPKPKSGTLLDESEIKKYAFLTMLNKMVRRSFVRHDYYHLPFPGRIYFAFAGAKIGIGCEICSPDIIQEPHLLEIGNHSLLGENSFISGHFRDSVSNEIVLGKIIIGSQVMIGTSSTIWPNVIIHDHAVVQGHSTVLPGVVIGEHEIWGGNPARCLWSGKKDNPTVKNLFDRSLISRDKILTLIMEYIADQRDLRISAEDLEQSYLIGGILDSLAVSQLYSFLDKYFGGNLNLEAHNVYDLRFKELINYLYDNLSKDTSSDSNQELAN